MKDLNDSSIPDHVRKGIDYDEKDLLPSIKPDVSAISNGYVRCY